MNSENFAQLEAENRRLKRAVAELSILNEIATAINSTMSVNQVVDLIVHKCVKLFQAEQAAVMLLDEKKEDNPFHTMVRRADRSSQLLPYRLNTQLTGWMLKHQTALLINDFPNDQRFQSVADKSFPVSSLLSVPLISKGRMIGLVTVFNKKSKQGYTSEDQRLLSIIATQSAQVIENARLSEEEQELLNVQKEMQMAFDIQTNLLPQKPPHLKEYDIAGVSIPAQVVGGDYFDFIPVDENRLAISLGDVSGKGLPAALLMANLQATIRAQTLLKLPPKDCMRHSNKLLFQSTDRQKFATLFYGILDSQNHQLCFTNAGHNKPIFCKANNKPVFLQKSGIALSLIKDFDFDEDLLFFDYNDLFLIYSDGITEAMNVINQEFGEQKLAALIQAYKNESSQELIEQIISAVNLHAGDRAQLDDMTLVAIKRAKT